MEERKSIIMSSSVDTSSMPRLQTATCSNIEIYKEYKSGAKYQGQVQDNRRTGRGTFSWPDGAKYDGEFDDNVRHGIGIQWWADGSSYDGEFVQDMRHGTGLHKWANEEEYEGKFFKDRRHGYGVYRWPDGSYYEGTFYMDRKEGYGKLTFGNGNIFQGLYKEDERFGPGVLTYPDGKQDVGLWEREKLVRLCTNIPGSFVIEDYTDIKFTPEVVHIKTDPAENRFDITDVITKPPNEVQYEDTSNLPVQQLFHETLNPNSLAIDIKSFDTEFFKEVRARNCAKNKLPLDTVKKPTSAKSYKSGNDSVLSNEQNSKPGSRVGSASRPESAKSGSKDPVENGSYVGSPSKNDEAQLNNTNNSKSEGTNSMVEKTLTNENLEHEDFEQKPQKEMVAWNTTPGFIAIQKHIMKHEDSEPCAGFDVTSVSEGIRTSFGDKGPLELASEEFLHLTMEGELVEVTRLLDDDLVHVNVCDKTGHFAILGASVHWHMDVVNCLLDHGANINQLNDAGVSALSATHVFFYTQDKFQYNIAERYLKPPPNLPKEEGYDINEAVKTFLKSRKGKKPKSAASKSAQVPAETERDLKKIQKFREDYKTPDEPPPDPEFSLEGEEKPLDEIARTLGMLQIKRAVKMNVEEVMQIKMKMNEVMNYDEDDVIKKDLHEVEKGTHDDTAGDAHKNPHGDLPNEFESYMSQKGLPIEVPDLLVQRAATALSTNTAIMARVKSADTIWKMEGTARRLAIFKSHQYKMGSTIRLLLRRGADPNASRIPMPVLFFAVKSGDVEAVRELLMRGACPDATLSDEHHGGLAPLHIAAALPGDEGVAIVELLLYSLADPDVRAAKDDAFLDLTLEEEWSKDVIPGTSEAKLGGRTPLMIACARDDNYRNACRVVHLLLDAHANPNLLCNGHSPLTLAIISGNDLAIDELLNYGADPNLLLTHGCGNALCIASSTQNENRRSPDGRIELIDKLVTAGADILIPVPIGPKRLSGTAVDFGWHMFNLDRRIAHMPYHALNHAEREIFNARKRLLAHLGDVLRNAAVEKERQRMAEELSSGNRSRSPSPSFIYTGAGQPLPPAISRSKKTLGSDSKVSFGAAQAKDTGEVRKPLFRYCYDCGRSVGVRLTPCTRCKSVYYCSKTCKVKAWNGVHKEECIRISGRSPSPGVGDGARQGGDSPTPTTDPDRNKPNTVKGIMASDPNVKEKVGKSKGQKGDMLLKGKNVGRGMRAGRGVPGGRGMRGGGGMKGGKVTQGGRVMQGGRGMSGEMGKRAGKGMHGGKYHGGEEMGMSGGKGRRVKKGMHGGKGSDGGAEMHDENGALDENRMHGGNEMYSGKGMDGNEIHSGNGMHRRRLLYGEKRNGDPSIYGWRGDDNLRVLPYFEGADAEELGYVYIDGRLVYMDNYSFV